VKPHSESFLFVGLGNPGRQYEATRHNIGYLVVQAFAKGLGWTFKEDKRFNARVAKGVIESKTIHLVLPLTYMNMSGVAVRRYIDYFKLSIHDLVVVADDVALAFGQLRLRLMGSSGGHNGLESIKTHLGTSHYIRLRMGIGHPGERVLTDFVLDPFSLTEQQEIPTFIDRGVEVLHRLLKEHPSHVMNVVNTVSFQIKKEPLSGSEPIDLTKPPSIG
jgi:peptidyl-tRNA hydrolase, PTH1 family